MGSTPPDKDTTRPEPPRPPAGFVAVPTSEAGASSALEPTGDSSRTFRGLGAPVSLDQIAEGLSEKQRLEVERLEESVLRRTADLELVREMALDGFEGHRYEVFVDELVRYALSVLRGWLTSGHIFTLTAKRGHAQHPSENELMELATDKDAREELASVTVASALRFFRRKALVEGGWDPEGGASVPTYFMGACVFAFPNEVRRHRAQRAKWGRQDRTGVVYDRDLDRGAVTDTAVLAIGRARVVDDLERVDPRYARIVAATLDGYSQAEIAEMFGEDSVRAVEGALYRWRKAEQRRLKHLVEHLDEESTPMEEGDVS